MNRLQANLLLLLAGAIWGMAFIAQAQAMDHIGPFLFIALRFIVASVVVLPFALLEARKENKVTVRASFGMDSRDLRKFALIGLALFCGMAFQQTGLLTTSVTNSGFLTGLYVVFTPIVAVVLFRDVLHPVVWPAALLAMAGIFFLSGGNAAALVRGDVLTILSAFFWSLQVVLIAHFVGQSDRPLTLSLVQFLVTAGLASFVAVILEPISWTAIVAAAPEILFTGVIASGLAFTLQVIGQRYTSAPQAAIFLSSEAPFAAFFAYLFLGERIGLLGLSGCLMIFLAMLLVELFPQWRSRRVTSG